MAEEDDYEALPSNTTLGVSHFWSVKKCALT